VEQASDQAANKTAGEMTAAEASPSAQQVVDGIDSLQKTMADPSERIAFVKGIAHGLHEMLTTVYNDTFQSLSMEEKRERWQRFVQAKIHANPRDATYNGQPMDQDRVPAGFGGEEYAPPLPPKPVMP
jgi:hypothetical protein